MHSSKLKKISAALCMALLPVAVFAAGLGKLNVESGIGEPLKADIELISLSPEELASLTATIASEEAYAAQSIERPASHNNIKVTVDKKAGGTPFIRLTTTQPITEPFLDMLLQVDWSSGRLLREYTVLLDPPGYKGDADDGAPATVAQLPTAGAGSKSVESGAAVSEAAAVGKKAGSKHRRKVVPASKEDAVSKEAEPKVATAPTGEEYVTQKGDTLSKIAQSMKPEGVSLDQMLVGLYKANPDAFSADNMNRLNVGKIIRPPTTDELNAITSAEAKKEIKVQTADWNTYRSKLGGMVAESAPTDTDASPQSSGGKIKTATEDKSTPASAGPKDVVKLSSGDKIDSKDTKALQDKVNALQEEATAREKSLKEAQDRTVALEKQIADMQKLVAMKSAAMAEAQKQAEASKAAPAVTPAPAAEPVKPVDSPKPAEAAIPAPNASAKPTPSQSLPPPVPVPVEEPSFFDGLIEDPMLLGGVGGLLALLGGGWMYLRNKRKKNLADFEQGIMTSGGLKANTVFGNTSGASVDTGDTSFLTDFSQSAHGGMIDTNDVDPIAEAEVYMAYGRDAQAEEILKDAISKEPKRYELHLKLLEMYAASKNMSAFEAVSGELYTTLGAADPVWAKVAAIGHELEPNNPLYHVSPSASLAKTDSAKAEFAKTEPTMADADKSKLDASDFANSPLASAEDFEVQPASTEPVFGTGLGVAAIGAAAGVAEFGSMDLGGMKAGDNKSFDETGDDDEPVFASDALMDEPSTMPTFETTPLEAGLDFDMGNLNVDDVSAQTDTPAPFEKTMPNLEFPSFDIETPPSVESAVEIGNLSEDTMPVLDTEEISIESPSIDAEQKFDFNITTISAPEQETPASTNVFQLNADALEEKPLDLSGISLEMNDAPLAAAPEIAAANEPVEVETKLELVAAYIEMEDKEGARELLQEVIKEGGTNQRKRAEDLLKQIA